MLTKTRLILIVFLLSIVDIDLCAQNSELTKAQMYEDFDSLISVIEYNNPHLGIYKRVMDFDVVENIKELRSEIENIKDITGYFLLISRCANLIPEAHAQILPLNEEAIKEFADSSLSSPVVIPPCDLQRTIDTYDSIWSKASDYQEKYFNAMFYLPVSYIDGQYYLTRPLQLVNQQDTAGFCVGDRVTGLNEISINDFIKENHRKYIDRLRWDVYNHQFYTECFLWVSDFPRESFPFNSLTITKKNGQQETVPFNLHTRYIIDAEGFLKERKDSLARYDRKPVIWYKDSLLYIKVPSMNPDDLELYETEIAKISRKQKISNVILDVRKNGGGGDPVWEKIVSLLTDKPLYRHQMLGVSNRDVCKRYLPVAMDSVSLYNDPILDRQFAIIAKESWAVAKPDSNSIQCKGKIYVLHDENTYSAANSLVTFALGCDKLVAVGVPTGYLSGYGVNPFVFQLPLSKILFMMHSVIQIPEEVSSADQYLWNQTEIRVIPSVRYANLFAEYQSFDFIYQYDFLNEYDPFFKAVMDDIYKK